MRLFVTIILDGVGVGEQEDSELYGDAGSDTLGHVCENRPLSLPHLVQLGLGRIRPLKGISATDEPTASFGKMREVSAGKDSTTGHWELSGIVQDRPFPTYPDGFPGDLINTFLKKTNCAGFLGGYPASGTTIITELGEYHIETGHPIIYTSADSVFQIAAHTDVIPIERLYTICEITREAVCVGDHAVGRVIARPFEGHPGAFSRISPLRKDFSLLPVTETLQESLQEHGIKTVSIGKIADLFGGVGFDETHKTRSNDDGVGVLLDRLASVRPSDSPTFIWVNLVDFDQEYGHRNNPDGFADALEHFDSSLPAIVAALPEGARLLLTADHGNDPTTASTDHSREFVPLLYYGSEQVRELGIRGSFRDHAATVADYFDVPFECGGVSFA